MKTAASIILCWLASMSLGTIGLVHTAHADEAFPVADSAVGHFYACDEKNFCQDVEQDFVSMPGCQVGMMPYMAQWIGDHDGFHLKTGRYECTPHEQTRV